MDNVNKNTEEENLSNEPTANEQEATESPKNDNEGQLAQQLADTKDKYLRLYADFDNFRRRNAKEKLEMVKTANQDLIVSLLSILDDFERAKKNTAKTPENTTILEGIDLIYNKLFKLLEQKGLKAMQSIGEAFDADLHEAITQIPAPSEDMKGKIVDEVEKGYVLDEKVIRFAKVVVGN